MGSVRRRRGRVVVPAILVVLAFVVAACGARVGSTQLSAARPGATGGANGAAASSGASEASGAGSANGATPAAGAAAAATSSGATGGVTSTTAVPAGGNGGATDVGVTANSITLGNVVTMSGPVPGLFAGAVIGTQAFLAYQNSLGGVFGRQLKLDVRDDQFDTGQNRAQTVDLVGKAFALVGGFSLYDDAGADALTKAGVPDVQVALTTGLQQSPINFAVAPVKRGGPTGPFEALKKKFPGSIGAVGGIYGDIPAAKDNYLNDKNVMESMGYKFVYERGYQATETDFTADVIRMKSSGVKFFFTNGDVKTIARLAKAMASQGFKPDAFVTFGSAYDATLVPLAGSAAEGMINVQEQALFLGEDAPYIPEVALADKWMQKVKPGFGPDLFAAYGWGSARMFVTALQNAGPKATRADVLAALRKIDNFSGNGMFPDAGPASKRPAICFLLVTVHNGRFERLDSPPPGFRCDNTVFLYRK